MSALAGTFLFIGIVAGHLANNGHADLRLAIGLLSIAGILYAVGKFRNTSTEDDTN